MKPAFYGPYNSVGMINLKKQSLWCIFKLKMAQESPPLSVEQVDPPTFFFFLGGVRGVSGKEGVTVYKQKEFNLEILI